MKDQLTLAGRAFPATSFTPAEPPTTVAVYVDPATRSVLGSRVAVRVVGSYETLAAIGVELPCATRTNVAVDTVPAPMASENVAVGETDVATPIAPEVGTVPVTAGGVVSAAAGVQMRRASAQSAWS